MRRSIRRWMGLVDISDLGSFAEKFGFPLMFLLFALWSGRQKWWVFGWTYEEKLKQIEKLEADVKEWKRLTFNALGVGDRASRVAEQTLSDAAAAEGARPRRRAGSPAP